MLRRFFLLAADVVFKLFLLFLFLGFPIQGLLLPLGCEALLFELLAQLILQIDAALPHQVHQGNDRHVTGEGKQDDIPTTHRMIPSTSLRKNLPVYLTATTRLRARGIARDANTGLSLSDRGCRAL